jgi:DNA-binding transcriptional MocR family regulator
MSESLQAGYLDRVEAPEIDYRAELPPHRQIAAWLLGRIESGELAIGQPVPSEKELMDLFGVARTTVRRSIAYLRRRLSSGPCPAGEAMLRNADPDCADL